MNIFNIGVSGDFDVEKREVSIGDSGEQIYGDLQHCCSSKNLITNTGMDALGTGTLASFFSFLQVGTSNSAPQYTDAALGALVAGVAFGTPTYAWDGTTFVITRVATFGVGVATGVLAELGIANGASSSTLRTRALFMDGGAPVTVTVLGNEQLIVTYRLRFAVSTADSTLKTTQKGQEYDLTLRPARLGMPELAGTWDIASRLSWVTNHSYSINQRRMDAYSGTSSAIGATTGEPGGTYNAVFEGNSLIPVLGPYTPGSHYRDDTVNLTLGQGNIASVGAWLFMGMPFSVQLGITPRVTKTASDLMSFTHRTAWSRD